MGWDLALLRWINESWACGPLDALMPAFHVLWPWALALAPLFVWSLWRGRPLSRAEALICLALIMAANIVASDVIKPLVDRQRPCRTVAGLQVRTPSGNCPSSRSFPSAHAANMFAAATYLSWRKRRRAWLFAVAALVALSRPYIGVHWPSDIAAGAFLGVGLGALAGLLHELMARPEQPPPLEITRVGRPLL